MAKFLYVEDRDMLRRSSMMVFKRAFRQDEFVAVTSYDEAVTAINQHGPFDGILSDYKYSGVGDNGEFNPEGFGGRDLLKFLIDNKINLPITFWSATDTNQIQRECNAVGVDIRADHIFEKVLQPIEAAVTFMKAKYCNETRPTDSTERAPVIANPPKVG